LYRPKPYAYLTFKDETVKEAAIDISCAFKSVSLTWYQPDQANSLCHICGRPNCSPDTCSKSNSWRSSSTKQVKDDRLNKLYARFNHFDSHKKPAFSRPVGRFRSRSRSRSQPSRNPHQTNNDDASKFIPNHPPNFTSQSKGHLYGSCPWNRIASQGMHNWDDDFVKTSLNERQALQSELSEVKILLTQISQQIQTVVSKLQYQESRLNVIEEKLDITPPDHELTPHEQSVLDNIKPMDEKSTPPLTGQNTQDEDVSFHTDVSFSSSTPSLSHQHTPLPDFNSLLQPTVVIPSSHDPNNLYKVISSISSNQAHLTQVLDRLSSRVDRFVPSQEDQSQY
jgi:hypothetical protein